MQTKNRFANGGAIGSAVYFDPTQPVYANNKYGNYFEWLQADGKPIDLASRNPLALLNLRNNRSTVNRLIGNVQLDYKLHFFPDLHMSRECWFRQFQWSVGKIYTDSTALQIIKLKAGTLIMSKERKISLVDVSLFYSKEIPAINGKIRCTWSVTVTRILLQTSPTSLPLA